jgi:hypothetical protein
MSAPDDIASLRAELAQLRKDTDRLRQELDDLHRFVFVEYDEDDKPTNVCINRCALITFGRPDAALHTQMLIAAGPDDQGPCISMWGSDEKPRITLEVEKDEPEITLYAPGLLNAVLIQASADSGCGMVGVLEKGKPRAIMKASPDGSAGIAVLHDDNHARAVLHSTAEHGEILVATPGLKTAVKLTSKSQIGGGLLTVHGHNGKPAVILTTVEGYGGCVMLNDPEGIMYESLPNRDRLGEEALEEE